MPGVSICRVPDKKLPANYFTAGKSAVSRSDTLLDYKSQQTRKSQTRESRAHWTAGVGSWNTQARVSAETSKQQATYLDWVRDGFLPCLAAARVQLSNLRQKKTSSCRPGTKEATTKETTLSGCGCRCRPSWLASRASIRRHGKPIIPCFPRPPAGACAKQNLTTRDSGTHTRPPGRRLPS